jgi:hypothetical protein
MPWPPPEDPSAKRGNGRLSTWPVGVLCGIDPVVSLCEALLEPKIFENRPASPLQLAAPKPINETATNRGHKADRRDAHMITRPHATNTSGRINYVAVNRHLSIYARI